MAINFIRIESTLEKANYQKESPIETFFYGNGVQLIPNTGTIRQTTDSTDGVELEDWTVIVCRCGEELQDITDYFNIDRVFQDNLARPQIDWSISNLPFDFGNEPVYLKISQVGGEDFYTTEFFITADEKEYVSRFDYKLEDSGFMQTVQLRTYFRQYINADTLEVYYQSSKNISVTKSIQQVTLEKWVLPVSSNDFHLRFRNMMNCKFVYVNLQRAGIYKALEIPELEASENFGEIIYQLSFQDEFYDPNYIAPIPDPDPVDYKAYIRGYTDQFTYQAFVRIPVFGGFTTLVTNFSTIGYNGGTFPFINSVATSENINLTAEQTMFFIVEQQMYVGGFEVTLSDGLNQAKVNYSSNGTPLVFTYSELKNGIEKEVEVTITYI